METITPQNSITHVSEILKSGADAIARVATQLQPDQVERALTLLAECRGKVIVIGVGKSGILSVW